MYSMSTDSFWAVIHGRAAAMTAACTESHAAFSPGAWASFVLRPLVGVEDFDSDILGIVKAGTSTGLGFCAFQSVQNVTFAQGSAWIDP